VIFSGTAHKCGRPTVNEVVVVRSVKWEHVVKNKSLSDFFEGDDEAK
jgi:hypothetical protein